MDNEEPKPTFDILKNFILNKSIWIMVHLKNKDATKTRISFNLAFFDLGLFCAYHERCN